MHWTDRRQRFRAVLAGDRCVHPGSVFDPISARIAEELGFEVGMFAGSIASFTVLGAPDIVLFAGERIEPVGPVRECRAPKGDKYLALAAAGGADVIVSSDVRHLLSM